MRVKLAPFLLLLPLLAEACGTPAPPKTVAGAPPASRIVEVPPATTRWRAVPAQADGATVPGGRRHVVKRGETGISIARAYGVNWSRIAAANRIDRDAVLNVGQALFIPLTTAGQPPQPARSAQRPAPRPTPSSPEDRAASFQLDVDDLITGSAEAVERAPAARPSAANPRPPASAQAAATAIPALSWPVDGRVILSSFGPKQGGRVNDGINIKALRGATVRAAADGQIIYVGDAIPGFGLVVLVRHGPPGPNAVVTAYGHLETALAERGARVQRGQPIARAGSSGSVSEPQLLFQLRQGRRAINPRTYLG